MMKNPKGISNAMFASGLIAAILASSLISVGVVTQLGLVKGPKGDKGDTGATGMQGPQGASGISKIPFDMIEGYEFDYTNSTEYTDIKGISLNITTEKSSNLLIIFSVNLLLNGPKDWGGDGWLRVLVNNIPANPEGAQAISQEGEVAIAKKDTFTFSKFVVPGTYTIKIQWMVSFPELRIALAFINPQSSLIVLALPYG